MGLTRYVWQQSQKLALFSENEKVTTTVPAHCTEVTCNVQGFVMIGSLISIGIYINKLLSTHKFFYMKQYIFPLN